MKEIPVLFSTQMVQAIIEGRKSQTRRLVKPQAMVNEKGQLIWENAPANKTRQIEKGLPMAYGLKDYCPYGQPGDLLWVRETWAPSLAGKDTHDYIEYIRYVADNSRLPIKWVKDYDSFRNRPGIHMNKEYARIWLKKTGAKVERASSISREDAIAEGLACITKDGGRTYKYGIPDIDGLPGIDDIGWPWDEWEVDPIKAFQKLWNKINGADTWNSWVWVNSFEILSTTGKPK